MTDPTAPALPSLDLLTPDELAAALRVRDLTDPHHGHHAIQDVIETLTAALAAEWGCQVRMERRHPVVPVEDNYDRLGYPADAVTRDARYTRYVSQTCMLRSHSSAGIPPALRSLARSPHPADVLLVCPGMAYRRDVLGRYHSGTPHLLDLWRIGTVPLGRKALLGMVAGVVAAILPGRSWRTTETEHPYTVGGLQIDVEHDGTWVEIGECGVAAPAVLATAGLPATTSGLAMGLGLDRLLMLGKGIPDIRLLRSADPRIAGQLLDLAPYRPVSLLPPVRRDLSVAWPAEVPLDDELLGERVRDVLGDESTAVEEVGILSRTPYSRLPEQARERLGMRPGQVNLLVRLVIRHCDRTLTAAEANAIRDRVYGALHASDRHQWAEVARPD